MNYSDFLGYLLSCSFRLLKKRIEKVLEPFELTAPQWGVLSRLYEKDGQNLVEISQKLKSDPSTIKLIIDKLEKKGYIKKISNKNDRRSIKIYLTENAKILEEPLRELILNEIKKAVKGFSDRDIELFKSFLKKLIKNLSEGTGMKLIEDYKLELFPPPCLPGATQWSGKITLNRDISDVLPYLNGYIEKRIYNPQAKTIVFNFKNHKVSVRPREIKISNISDRTDGEKIAKEVIDFINEVWEKKEEIEPDYEKKEPPKVVEIYKLLPKTNCGKCNHPSCFVFATKLSQQDVEIYECPEINNETRNKLEKLFWG